VRRQEIRGKTESGGALTGGQLLTLLSGGQGVKRREGSCNEWSFI